MARQKLGIFRDFNLMDPSDRKKKYIDDLYMTTNLES
jgi:hypothetical protein